MPGKTILIADNSLINRAFLSGILEDEYTILEADDGQQALDMLREQGANISVMLLDIMMPVKDGYEVMAEMAADSAISDIPVIVVTAESEAATELRMLNAGAMDFLTKPIEPVIARRRIKAVVDQRELEELHIQNRLYEELRYQSDHDELTGIFSKDAFYRETHTMLLDRPDEDFILIRWDIEKFKLVNELFGISTGDRMLQAAARSVAARVGSLGTYGRFGSDNFVICVPAKSMDAEQFMQEIIADLRNSFEDAGLTQAVVVVAGIYRVTEHDLPVGQMCDRAGMALSTVKGDYDRHIAYYDDKLLKRLLDEQDILDNMDEALANGEFEVYLQPVYSLSNGHPVSAEALVRWNRPGQGVVSPGLFIPLFERNGFISKLDYNVWDQVCHIQITRAEKGLVPLPISVNLSRKSLYNPHLYEEIVALTEEHGIAPHLFRIEVTESAYMDNAAQLIQTVTKLQEHGYPILMDDFGSGYSSFNTLKDIPINMLKVDMKFMEGFENGGRVGTILASILRMTKWLGIPVIAEGVETVEQYEFLRSIGCDYTQGFYFARPMTYDDFERHLSGQPKVLPEYTTSFSVKDVDEVMGGDQLFDRVMNDIMDAYAIYEYHGGNLEVVRANEGYFKLFGYDMNTFKRASVSVLDNVVPEDRGVMMEACRIAIDSGKPSNVAIDRKIDENDIVKLHAMCSCIGTAGSDSALLFIAYRVVDNGGNADIPVACPMSPINQGKKLL